MAEQNEMLKIVTPMMEHVCDHLCRFPGEISDQEELNKICGGCHMGDHICNIRAHYYVDFDGSVWQSVEDKNIAWHCGAKKHVHTDCRNANSIGIEMCVRNKGSKADTSQDWYFRPRTMLLVTLTTFPFNLLMLLQVGRK